MICTDRDIIIFNQKLDIVTKKSVYIPTQISGVSVYDSQNASSTGSEVFSQAHFKIRIPLNAKVMSGRTYVSEAQYEKLSAVESASFWTIHNDDIIIVLRSKLLDVNTPMLDMDLPSMQNIRVFSDSQNAYKDVIRITNYSDNSTRGIQYLRHWRIAGV